MNTNHLRKTAAHAAAALLTLGLALAAAPAGATGNTGSGSRDVCTLAPKYLPKTPDAVEGWLRHCPSR
jgi:hypothetical protein